MKKLIAIIICLLFTSLSYAINEESIQSDIDIFGGWTSMQSSTPLAIVGNSSDSVTETTLTDTGAFAGKDLSNRILQPDVSEYTYFLIDSNTDNTVTIIPCDRPVEGDEHEVYVDITDFNDGTDEYAVLGSWRAEKINGRWWGIDPLDNVFFFKGINNFSGSGYGIDENGNDQGDNLETKHGDTAGKVAANRIPDVKDMGYNILGIGVSGYMTPDDLDYTKYELMPYMAQVRVSSWNFSDVGEIDFRGDNHMDETWVDAYDPDWEGKFNDYPNGVFGDVAGWGFGVDEENFRQSWNAWDVSPYKERGLNNASNPWLVGYNLDEEPAGSASYGHLGYYLFVASESDTDADDGILDSHYAAINYLRAKYTDGGEAEFIANLTYDGDYETATISAWSNTVGGYVDAQHDTDALTNLNTAWGTTYSSWENVRDEDGTDTYSFETQSGCSSSETSCDLSSADAEILQDLDEVQGNYARKYMYPFHQHLFSETGYFKGNKINFGIGIGKYIGWAYGLVSEDKQTKYSQIFNSRGIGGANSGFTSADQGLFPSAESRAIYKEMYDYTDIPMIHESVWITGEPDSFLGKSGTIDAVYKIDDSDYAVYIGTYDGASASEISQDASITWDEGAETGTLWWQFDNTVNTSDFGWCTQSCGVTSGECCDRYDNMYIVVADTGSIGKLVDDDIITDGENTFTINGVPTRVSMIVDNDADFDTAVNNPKALANFYYWTLLVNENDPSPRRYYMTNSDYTTDRSIICYKDFIYGGSYNGFPGNYTDVEVGNKYHLTFTDSDKAGFQPLYYELDTQEKRANMFVNILKQSFSQQGTDGIYFDLGYYHWCGWDYGFADYTARETRNFGIFTIKDNLYDGVEATTLGADGIAGTWDDEERDYGDFATPMGQYLKNIYRELQPKTKLNTTGAFSGSIR